ACFGCRSMIILPLHLADKPFGVLILCAWRTDEFNGIQVEYPKETAPDTSFGIEMLRTKGEERRLALLSERHEQMLGESPEETLTSIAIDNRNARPILQPGTGGVSLAWQNGLLSSSNWTMKTSTLFISQRSCTTSGNQHSRRNSDATWKTGPALIQPDPPALSLPVTRY
ncbi:MAG: GAF domain-containing protein, partial [Gallionella sp.]